MRSLYPWTLCVRIAEGVYSMRAHSYRMFRSLKNIGVCETMDVEIHSFQQYLIAIHRLCDH